MENNNRQTRQDIELARHDERLRVVEGFVEEIKENHLPHIYNRLAGIENKLAYYAGGIVVAGMLAQYLINKI